MTSVVKRGTLALFPNSGEWTATSAEHPSMCQLEHVRRENPLTRWCRTDDVEANVAMENKHTASSVLHDCDCFSGRSHPIARHHVKTCVDNYLGFKRAPIAKSAEASCPVEMSSCKNTAAKLYCSPASRPAPPPVCFGHRECHAGVQPFCCKPHFDDPHFRPFVSCTSTPFASPKVADDYSAAAVVLEKKNNTHYNKNFKESHCRAFSQSETSVCLPLNTSRRIHGPGVSTPPPPPLIEGLNTQGHIRVVKPGHPDAVCLMRDSSPTAKTTRQDILWECCTFHGRDVTPATTCASPQSPLLPKALSSHTACPSFSDATVAACNARESEHNPQKHIHAMDGTWQDSSSKTTNVLCIASEQPRPFDVPSAELKKPSGPLTPNATSLSQNALQCQPSAVEDVGPDGFAAAAVHKPVLLSLRNAPITHSWKSLETAVGIMEIPKDIIWVRRRCRCRRFTRLSGSTSSVAFELARDNTACSKEWSKLSHLDRQPMPYVPIYYVQRRNCRLLWSCCRGSRYTLSEHEVQAIAKLSYISQHPYDPCNPLHERLLHKYWLAGLHALASSQHLLATTDSVPQQCSTWLKLGFQGHNPRTDFRGGGILSLACMVYFAEQHTTYFLQIVKEANRMDSYPFSAGFINVALMLIVCFQLKPDAVHCPSGRYPVLSQKAFKFFARLLCDTRQHAFEELFCCCCISVHQHWRRLSHRSTLLHFQRTLRHTQKRLIQVLESGPQRSADFRKIYIYD